jgi:hypothetical protein
MTATVLAIPACKTTGGLLNDIGNAVDKAATSVVDAGRKTVDGSAGKAPPPSDDGTAPAGDGGDGAEMPESDDEAVTRAREAYEAGKLAYRTAQYEEAVDHFLTSFADAEAIEDDETRAQVQSTLYYNLGQAQLKAYGLDRDRARLTQARDLLRNHLHEGYSLTEAERADTEKLIAEIESKISEHDAAAD